MSAIVTDQFRILNANNFVESVENTNNSYYIFIGLSNPKGTNTLVGFGRTTDWDTNTPSPTDSFAYRKHSTDTMMFGRKISSANIRRVVRRIDWVSGNKYEIYRDDYSAQNPSPNTKANSLYDSNYYVLNSDFKVYVCIDNGSSGDNPTGNVSQDEPTFTDLEPSKAGSSGDGYVWKYLFTISPSDIVKFDSTEFITVPNGWSTSTDSQIRNVRENGNSNTNLNQIKHIYIENSGVGYKNGNGQEVDIIGDGTNGKARVDVVGGKIIDVTVSSGGKGYTYALVDLGNIRTNAVSTSAKLVPIIPPSLGHGYDIYTELGTDKVICYSRFDDTTKDFPTDTKFAQIGIVKNPSKPDSTDIYTADSYSSLQAIKFSTVTGTPKIGEVIEQVLTVSPNNEKIARGYVASFDQETKVIKYFRDRSLNFNPTQLDHTDFVGVSTDGRIFQFESSVGGNVVKGDESGFTGSVETGFTGVSTITSGNKLVNLGTNFNAGLSQSEINKGSGEVIYLDNRPEITRSTRQKEDIKIILEF
ncbi:MAG: hypothetical protein CML93_03490 [Rhodobiaceae bacterium]|nr:hypothetical protein [Rhodobiaceae bacterium]